MDLNLSNLEKKHNGIWYSKLLSQISYPDKGNADCYQLEDNSFWFQHRNAIILELVKKYSPTDTFWDIGGGNGFVAKSIQDAGIESVLIEPGETGCLNAKSRGLSNVICATLKDAELPKNMVKSCGLFDVLEHIEDDNSFLQMLNSSMDKSGLVYLTVPALNQLWSDEDVSAGHYRRYSVSTIRDVFEKNGFEVLYVSYFFAPLVIPIFLFRSLPTKLGISRDVDSLDKHKKEHASSANKSLPRRVIEWLLKKEISKVNSHKQIFTGSSCILVAKKK